MNDEPDALLQEIGRFKSVDEEKVFGPQSFLKGSIEEKMRDARSYARIGVDYLDLVTKENLYHYISMSKSGQDWLNSVVYLLKSYNDRVEAYSKLSIVDVPASIVEECNKQCESAVAFILMMGDKFSAVLFINKQHSAIKSEFAKIKEEIKSYKGDLLKEKRELERTIKEAQEITLNIKEKIIATRLSRQISSDLNGTRRETWIFGCILLGVAIMVVFFSIWSIKHGTDQIQQLSAVSTGVLVAFALSKLAIWAALATAFTWAAKMLATTLHNHQQLRARLRILTSIDTFIKMFPQGSMRDELRVKLIDLAVSIPSDTGYLGKTEGIGTADLKAIADILQAASKK